MTRTPKLLRLDGTGLAAHTGKLGRLQRAVLAGLYERHQEIDGTGRVVDRSELARLGVPWHTEGAEAYRVACNHAVRAMERRGLLLRQNTNGSPATGRPRTTPADPHLRTTHVQLLPSGLTLGRRLSERARDRERIRSWPTLSAESRGVLLLALIEWRCLSKRHPKPDVLALIECHRAGENPAERFAWVRAFGAEVMDADHGATNAF